MIDEMNVRRIFIQIVCGLFCSIVLRPATACFALHPECIPESTRGNLCTIEQYKLEPESQQEGHHLCTIKQEASSLNKVSLPPHFPAFFSMAACDSRVSMECVKNGTIEGEAGAVAVSGSCTEIIVVRHGETEWNALHKMQGQMDIDLNEVGRQQAIAVAERLSKEPNISAIYTSDLKRALETAEIIASRCGGLKVVTDKDLRERHIGDLQGLTYTESPNVNPKAFEALKSPRSDLEIPGGGESRDQVYKRCTSSLQRIAEKHRGARVVAVTHGAVIEMLYKRAIPGGRAGGVWNTSVNIFQLSEGDIWSIKLWNDKSHLRETEYLESAFGGGNSSC